MLFCFVKWNGTYQNFKDQKNPHNFLKHLEPLHAVKRDNYQSILLSQLFIWKRHRKKKKSKSKTPSMTEWYCCNYSKWEKATGRWKETSERHLAPNQTRQPWPSHVTPWRRQGRHVALGMGSWVPWALWNHHCFGRTCWKVRGVAPGTSWHPPRGEETHFGVGEGRRGLFLPTAVVISLPLLYSFIPYMRDRGNRTATTDWNRIWHRITSWTHKPQLVCPYPFPPPPPKYCCKEAIHFNYIPEPSLEIPIPKHTSSPSSWISERPFWVLY